jgi:hypothetical protein
MFNLSKMDWRCFSTVLTLMERASAICLLARPCFSDDFNVWRGSEEVAEAFADNRVVIGKQDGDFLHAFGRSGEKRLRSRQVRWLARPIDSHLSHEQEHFGFIGFFQQASGLEVHDLFAEVGVLAASHEDDRNVCGDSETFHVAGEVKAVLIWKADVQQEEIGAIVHGHHERLKRTASDGGFKAEVPQTDTHGGCGVGVIFNDKDLFHK